MMIDPYLLERFSEALHNRLSTHLTLLTLFDGQVRAYDQAPENPVFPYITYGDVRVDNVSGDAAQTGRVNLTLHVWSRYEGRAELMTLLQGIVEALQSAPLQSATGKAVSLLVPFIDILRAQDGRTRHGLIRVSAFLGETS